jgi:hypothetical protein
VPPLGDAPTLAEARGDVDPPGPDGLAGGTAEPLAAGVGEDEGRGEADEAGDALATAPGEGVRSGNDAGS